MANLLGKVESVSEERLSGWAADADNWNVSLAIDFFAGPELIGRVFADEPRPDLAAAGFGSGRYGFSFHIPAGIEPGWISVRPTGKCPLRSLRKLRDTKASRAPTSTSGCWLRRSQRRSATFLLGAAMGRRCGLACSRRE